MMLCLHNCIEIKMGTVTCDESYRDDRNKERYRRYKNAGIYMLLWDFELYFATFRDVAFFKASTTLFLKRDGQKLSKGHPRKIGLNKRLSLPSEHHDLYFISRQKNEENFLQIALVDKRTADTKSVYLDSHDVEMLNTALHKAINLMQPRQYYKGDELYGNIWCSDNINQLF